MITSRDWRCSRHRRPGLYIPAFGTKFEPAEDSIPSPATVGSKEFSLPDLFMLLSPIDDFKNRTLRALPSLLEKLVYACSLRDKDGTYKHWGLTKAYGQQKADGAIGQAHTAMSPEIIKTPL